MRRTAIQHNTRRRAGCRYCGQEIEMARSPGGRPVALDVPVHLLPQQIGLLTGAVAAVAYVVSPKHGETCPVLSRRARWRRLR